MGPRVVSVVNLKGGSGKTTTSVFTAHALHAQGERVLLVDADPQGSAVRWSELADWDLPTVALPTKTLHRQLNGITPKEITCIVIDTPPLELQAGIVYSAVRASSQVMVPMAPSPGEADVLPDVRAVLDEMEPLRHNPLPHAVSLNRTVYRAISTRATRAAAEQNGWDVFSTEIPRKELYSQAFGSRVENLGAYKALAAEVLAVEVY